MTPTEENSVSATAEAPAAEESITREIGHAAFLYHVNGEERLAMRGQTIELPPDEAERGDRIGAFITDADRVLAGRAPQWPPLVSVRDMSEDTLIAWFANVRPDRGAVIAAAEGDPILARRLMSAEYNTGSRVTQLAALNSLISGLPEVWDQNKYGRNGKR
jgi:hypothetical protein